MCSCGISNNHENAQGSPPASTVVKQCDRPMHALNRFSPLDGFHPPVLLQASPIPCIPVNLIASNHSCWDTVPMRFSCDNAEGHPVCSTRCTPMPLYAFSLNTFPPCTVVPTDHPSLAMVSVQVQVTQTPGAHMHADCSNLRSKLVATSGDSKV